MDYKKLYNNFIKYCKETTPKERLEKRDPKDPRLNSEYIYTETHHIIPSHDNGTDDISNLVVLLPEEHLFAHQIRYKAYKQRGDMLAVRFILNGLKFEKNSKIKKAKKSMILSKKILKGYAWMKQNSSEFRKEIGWQTEDGKKRISEARKGTFPAIDAKTGESIGSVPSNHPKVLNGEWIHHSKGKAKYYDKIDKKYVYIKTDEAKKNPERFVSIVKKEELVKGEKNPNFKDFATPDFLLEVLKKYERNVVKENKLIRYKYIDFLKKEVKEKFNKKISEVIIKNRFGSWENFIDEYNKKYNKNISKRSYRNKKLLSKINKNKNLEKCKKLINVDEEYNKIINIYKTINKIVGFGVLKDQYNINISCVEKLLNLTKEEIYIKIHKEYNLPYSRGVKANLKKKGLL